VNPLRLIRTTGFRLAALFALIFTIAAAVLLGLVYWYTIGETGREIERLVDSRLDTLRATYDAGGMSALVAAVQRESRRPVSRYLFAVVDADGRMRAGNLPARGLGEDWEEFVLDRDPRDDDDRRKGKGKDKDDDDDDEDRVPVRGRGAPLPGGGLLWVGHDIGSLHELREQLTGAMAVGLAATVLLSLGAGLFMGWQVNRRVEAMNRTARSIMAGDLSRRLAVGRSGDEFDRLAEQFNAMLERIQALMENVQRVSSDIAHDLRTPLTHLRQRLETARDADSAAPREALEAALADTDAILKTLDALLRIAQIESGKRRAAFSSVDLGALLADLVETYEPVAEDMGQTLDSRLEPGAVIHGDRELLTQLFANLIENALRHCPRGSRVTVSSDAGPGGIAASVADNGAGIAAPERRRVLEPFFRLDASRSTAGSGLGLTLARAVAELHGAQMALEDNQPGLRVSLRFPD